MLHVKDIEALLRKNKNQNSEETSCIISSKPPDSLTITSNLLPSQIIIVVYIPVPQRPSTIGHSSTADTMGYKQSCFQYRKAVQRLDERSNASK